MKIEVNHIPYNTANNRRPNIKQNPEFITIHSTGNEKSNAKGERGWLTNPTNTRTASWHYAVDETTVVEAIPPNEVAWHAGDGSGKGNRASISIEICESGNRAKTIANAVELVKHLRAKHNIKTPLKRHFDWSKKICPRIFYNNGTWSGWEQFKKDCEGAEKPNTAPKPSANTKPSTLAPKPSKSNLSLPTGIVKRGAKGEHVKTIQRALNLLNFKCGVEDGIWGAKTDDALRRFQSVYANPVDGIYGSKTRSAMQTQLNK